MFKFYNSDISDNHRAVVWEVSIVGSKLKIELSIEEALWWKKRESRNYKIYIEKYFPKRVTWSCLMEVRVILENKEALGSKCYGYR